MARLSAAEHVDFCISSTRNQRLLTAHTAHSEHAVLAHLALALLSATACATQHGARGSHLYVFIKVAVEQCLFRPRCEVSVC